MIFTSSLLHNYAFNITEIVFSQPSFSKVLTSVYTLFSRFASQLPTFSRPCSLVYLRTFAEYVCGKFFFKSFYCVCVYAITRVCLAYSRLDAHRSLETAPVKPVQIQQQSPFIYCMKVWDLQACESACIYDNSGLHTPSEYKKNCQSWNASNLDYT